jgi:hypothetical protein
MWIEDIVKILETMDIIFIINLISKTLSKTLGISGHNFDNSLIPMDPIDKSLMDGTRN